MKRNYIRGPNILLTLFCNQNCPFCFSLKEMQKTKIKEISLDNYSQLLSFLRKSGANEVFLLGGEPTLHSRFEKIIKISLQKGMAINLFTNGLVSGEKLKLLSKLNLDQMPKVNVNISTPAFLKDKAKRRRIIKFVEILSKNSLVTLVITIDSFKKNYFKLFGYFPQNTLRECFVKIGIAGSFLRKNGFTKKKAKLVGRKIKHLIGNLHRAGVKRIFLSQIAKCMFSSKDHGEFSDKKVIVNNFGCLGKKGDFDILPNLEAIKCFPTANIKKINFAKKDGKKLRFNNLKKTTQLLTNIVLRESRKFLPECCLECFFYGIKRKQCPGPCLFGGC